MRNTVFLFLVLLLLSGCISQKNILGKKKLKKEFTSAGFSDDHFSGILITDASDGRSLLEYNNHKLFTPASNTKILTFYLADQILKDSIPSIKYCIKNDTMYFSGLADPTFLHPEYPQQKTFGFLNDFSGKLVYIQEEIVGKRYGPGWAWDDYPFNFQPERNVFPLYGNCFWISKDTSSNELQINPDVFDLQIIRTEKPDYTEKLWRSEKSNRYQLYSDPGEVAIDEASPFITSDSLTLFLLDDTLKTQVAIGEFPEKCEQKILYNYPKDSLFLKLLVESDNFIAEQLLLASSYSVLGKFDPDSLISYGMQKYFSDWTGQIEWRDGSGLSRYNMMSPDFLVWLLTKIYHENDWERIENLFPDAGKEGTLKGFMKNDAPSIFAKSGSMTGVYNLSGYLVTDKGKTLIFSFMNNSFNRPAREIRKEVENFLSEVKKAY